MNELFNAIEHSDGNKVKDILESGQNPNVKGFAGQTPLHLAVDVAIEEAIYQYDLTKIITKPKIETIKLLLQYGADINATDEKGATALDWANGRNFKEAVKLMTNFNYTIDEK